MSQVFLSEVLRAWSEAGNEASGLHAWKMSIYRLQLSKSLCSSTTGSWKSCLFSAAHQSMGWALLGPDLLSSGLGPRGSVQGVRTDVRGQSRWPFFHPWKSVKQTTYCRAAPFVWCHRKTLSHVVRHETSLVAQTKLYQWQPWEEQRFVLHRPLASLPKTLYSGDILSCSVVQTFHPSSPLLLATPSL